MIKILIVDDEENMRILFEAKLKKDYEITTACNGIEALQIIEKKHFDLLLVDAMMPELNGYDLIRTIRNMGLKTPAIMVTAKGKIDDKIKGFDSGSDDYMTKPVDFQELNARIKAILRRNQINKDKEIVIGDVVLNSASYSLKKGKNIIYFPQKEFQILFLLLSYPQTIFSKEQILDSVWGVLTDSDEATIRTHMNRLRAKVDDFEEFEIETVRGIGYKAVIKDRSL